MIHAALDDTQLLVRDIKPQPATLPATLNLGAAGDTFDSMLRVPGAMEPRIERKLKEDIPELQWEDLAENWGKIRIIGTTRESFQRIVVSISRTKRLSISALAEERGRKRGSVTRDVNKLKEFGLLRLRDEINPGHGGRSDR